MDWLNIGIVVGFCEISNESMDSINAGEILNQLFDSQLIKKECTPWSLKLSKQFK
jgi:hypothetical protein